MAPEYLIPRYFKVYYELFDTTLGEVTGQIEIGKFIFQDKCAHNHGSITTLTSPLDAWIDGSDYSFDVTIDQTYTGCDFNTVDSVTKISGSLPSADWDETLTSNTNLEFSLSVDGTVTVNSESCNGVGSSNVFLIKREHEPGWSTVSDEQQEILDSLTVTATVTVVMNFDGPQ